MSLETIGAHYSKLRCDALYALRPPDLKGSISIYESRFLHRRILNGVPDLVVEIGTCAGLSTAVIGDALLLLNEVHGGSRRVVSYDNAETCFYDRTKPVAFFLDLVSSEIRDRVKVRTRCTAHDLKDDIAPQSLTFLFIDASHAHPWPCLDLWAALPYLHPKAEVCFHDVNLPIANPRYPSYGVKFLFDALILDKRYSEPTPGRVSNMGSVLFGGEFETVREQILGCIRANLWETTVQRAWLESVGIFEHIQDSWEANAARLQK